MLDLGFRPMLRICSEIGEWCFSHFLICMLEIFSFPHCSTYVWEIMHATIRKMIKHVTKLQKEVEEAHDQQEAAQRKVAITFSIRKTGSYFPWQHLIILFRQGFWMTFGSDPSWHLQIWIVNVMGRNLQLVNRIPFWCTIVCYTTFLNKGSMLNVNQNNISELKNSSSAAGSLTRCKRKMINSSFTLEADVTG